MIKDPTKVNSLGSLLSKLPVSPKYAKMLVIAQKYNVLHFAIMIVACLSVNEIFTELPSESASCKNQQDEKEMQLDPDLVTSLDIQRQKDEEKKKR